MFPNAWICRRSHGKMRPLDLLRAALIFESGRLVNRYILFDPVRIQLGIESDDVIITHSVGWGAQVAAGTHYLL